MSYAIYNIGIKILHIKPGLYSNSQPHHPNLNPLWSKTLSLFTRISTLPQDINNLTFKSLYQTLLQPDPNPISFLNTTIPKLRLQLTLAKPRPSLFSNLKKEIFFLTAYKVYIWGCFFSKHNFKPQNPNDFLCKICLSPSDDAHHLFFHCPFTRNLISHLEPFPTSIIKNLLLSHKRHSTHSSLQLHQHNRNTTHHNIQISIIHSIIPFPSKKLQLHLSQTYPIVLIK